MDDYEIIVQQAQAYGADSDEKREAFSKLIEAFQGAAQTWAYAALGDLYLAEDVAQEAFIAAYRNLDQLHDPKAFPSWLKRIVLSQCHRLTRRKQILTGPLDDDDTPAPAHQDPADAAEDRELRDKLREAIDDLPDHERAVTELYYLVGYSQDEIAEQLQLPVTTIKKRLQYARERLRLAIPQEVYAMLGASYPADFDMTDLFDELWGSEPLEMGYAASFADASLHMDTCAVAVAWR
jgi:RNA polymerase sigma factor (sigma-70 family)